MIYNAPQSIINDNLFKNFENFKSVVLFGTGNLGKIALILLPINIFSSISYFYNFNNLNYNQFTNNHLN